MISQISFGSRAIIECRKRAKEGLETAQTVLRESQAKYGKPKSTSWLWLKSVQHQGDPRYADIFEKKIQPLAEEYGEAIMFRPDSLISRMTENGIQGVNSYGNCGECASVVQYEFMSRYGKPSVNMTLDVRRNGEKYCDHAFNVSNLRAGANPKDPTTWGREAVVTDLWAGVTMKAKDALAYFDTLFKVNPETDKVIYGVMSPEGNPIQKLSMKQLGMLKEEKPPLFSEFKFFDD